MTMIKVVAAEGRRVRDPANGRVIPADGVTVDDTVPYWRKRLNQRDVVEAKAEASAPTSPPASPPPPAPAPAAAPVAPAAPQPAAKPTQTGTPAE